MQKLMRGDSPGPHTLPMAGPFGQTDTEVPIHPKAPGICGLALKTGVSDKTPRLTHRTVRPA